MGKKRPTQPEQEAVRDPENEAEDLEAAKRRAEALERFLREKPWEEPLEQRHQVYLRLNGLDIPEEDLGEYIASLVTGMPHIGRQGYSGTDKPPFDLASPDGGILVDAKVMDSGKSKAQNRLKVKRDRPGKQFKRWAEGGERAVTCQMVRGRKGWFLVPGIPIKDVPLGKDVTADFDEDDLLKPIRLLDKADLSDSEDFEKLEAAWRKALEHLQRHEGELMTRVREERRKFTDKEAEETLVDDFERPIWIAKAMEIPKAKEQLVEQVYNDEEAKEQLGERFTKDDEFMRAQLGDELFRLWKARQQNAGKSAVSETAPEQPLATPKKGNGGRKKR